MLHLKEQLDVHDIFFEAILLIAVSIIMIYFWKLYFANRKVMQWSLAFIGINLYAVGSFFDLFSEFVDVSDAIDNMISKGFKAVGISLFSYGMVKIITYLIHLNRTDAQTQLFSKQFFLATIEKESKIATRQNQVFSLIFLDVNGFKQINDTLGHKIGDAVLQEVAVKIKKEIRQTDIAARYGGDEFVILLPQTDATQSKHILNSIQISVSKLDIPNNLSISISGGFSTFPTDTTSITNLLHLADERMYKNKAELKKLQ
ncbi:GGDEF domain-containing protein [Metabacillus malikii]|uniref:GGDEF domain-containing protein n=1 Tax=Metabacillus malikii TaxID=1504265 RepID=UPI0027D9028F|nr:GGDEF domain-containing protein [Metabacillus malikii]